MKQETNLLGEALKSVKDVWRHRKGNELPAAILDTVDALWPEDRPRPLLTHSKKTPTGHHLIFTLRPGVAFSDMKNRLEHFSDACRRPVTIERIGGYCHLHIFGSELQSNYPYQWEDNHKGALPFPIGYSQGGALEVLDLARAPHLLVAGTTGYGKSTLLLVLIHSLLPRAKVAIIDFKRLQFAYLKNHCAFAKNEEQSLQLIRALNREMERRIDILEDAGVEKISEYRGDMDHIVLVIDEIAELQNKEAIYLLDRIVRLARAVGISVVAATQRPSKKVAVFAENTRDQFAARVCYLMPDEVSSRLVLGETCSMAAQLPEIPGRGVYKYGSTTKEIQSMFLDLKQAKKLLHGLEGVDHGWHVGQGQRLLPRPGHSGVN